MDLEYYKNFFLIVNTSAFCAKYDLTYDHIRRVLKGDRPLSESLKKDLSEAIKKFKEEF